MSLVRLEGVVREIGTFVILDRIDAAIAPGERVGLVGPNGAGKTTLLRIVSGRDEADRGTVTRRRALSMGLLGQEAHFDEAFMAAPDLRAAVRHGAAHLERMALELEALEHEGHAAGTRYADLQHRFDILGGYTLDQRVDEALSGLGFARDEWLRPPTALSGGQQTRAALARLVVADPDLLMLDEPTNHLDISAIEWLEEHLRRRSGALLVASHDRAFLDATVQRVWELRDRRLTVFRGDYSAYHRQRVERDQRAEREAESQADAIEREVELVQRYRSQRKHTKMHEHEARLERLKAGKVEAPRRSTRSLRLHGSALAGGPVRSGELVVRLEDLAVGYLPGRGALAPDGSEAAAPSRSPRRRSSPRSAGSGSGSSGPTAPARRRCSGRSPATCRRSTASSPSATRCSRATSPSCATPPSRGRRSSTRSSSRCPSRRARRAGYLARFLFRGDDVFKEVRQLSGGERSRLELALLGILPSNLLLLDEPTNHLDIAAREAIEAFLAEVARHAARRVARPAAAREHLRAPVGGRRGARRAVRRRLPGLAPGGGRGLDGRGRGEAPPEPDPARRAGSRPADPVPALPARAGARGSGEEAGGRRPGGRGRVGRGRPGDRARGDHRDGARRARPGHGRSCPRTRTGGGPRRSRPSSRASACARRSWSSP